MAQNFRNSGQRLEQKSFVDLRPKLKLAPNMTGTANSGAVSDPKHCDHPSASAERQNSERHKAEDHVLSHVVDSSSRLSSRAAKNSRFAHYL